MTTTASKPSRSFGDVTAEQTRCTVLDANGEPCGRPGAAGMPVGVCLDCGVRIVRAVLKHRAINPREFT